LCFVHWNHAGIKTVSSTYNGCPFLAIIGNDTNLVIRLNACTGRMQKCQLTYTLYSCSIVDPPFTDITSLMYPGPPKQLCIGLPWTQTCYKSSIQTFQLRQVCSKKLLRLKDLASPMLHVMQSIKIYQILIIQDPSFSSCK